MARALPDDIGRPAESTPTNARTVEWRTLLMRVQSLHIEGKPIEAQPAALEIGTKPFEGGSNLFLMQSILKVWPPLGNAVLNF